MTERKKTYKIKTKLATNNSMTCALESICEFWYCKPEELKLEAIHDNLFKIVKNEKIMEPVLWWQDKRFGNSIIRIWHFCTLA